MYLQLGWIAEKNKTYDSRENEHRDTGTQIYTEVSIQLLFRLPTTDSPPTYQLHATSISSATLPP